MEGGSRKAIAAALFANAGIAVAKFVGFAFTGAASMLAEAVHSGADTTNQGLLFLGGSRSRKKPSREHPFGYGRERYFWGFVVAVVLFALGSVFAIVEGIEKLRHPHEVTSPLVAVVILVVAIVLESFSFRTAIIESARVKGDASWWGFIRQAKVPELPVVLLEDAAALIGLVLALLGVSIAAITGNGVFDGIGIVCIGVLLVVIAVILAVETKSLLIGESAQEDIERAIVSALEAGDEVERVIHLRTEHLGPEELLVAAKIAVRHDDTAHQVARGIDAAERRVRAAVPIARLIYLEPDLYDAARPRPTPPPRRSAAPQDS